MTHVLRLKTPPLLAARHRECVGVGKRCRAEDVEANRLGRVDAISGVGADLIAVGRTLAASPAVVLSAERLGADLWARLAGALVAALGVRTRARVSAGRSASLVGLALAIGAALSGGARDVAGAAAAVTAVAVGRAARGLAVRRGTHPVFAHSVTRA